MAEILVSVIKEVVSRCVDDVSASIASVVGATIGIEGEIDATAAGLTKDRFFYDLVELLVTGVANRGTLYHGPVTLDYWSTAGQNTKTTPEDVVQDENGDSGREVELIDARQAIERCVAKLPSDYAALRIGLASLHDASRSVIAEKLQEPLNQRAQTMPRATYAEKKVVAAWINEEARQFGLALTCPRTGAPALLRAQPGGPNGRFAIEVTDERGKRHHTSTTVELPPLRLRTDDLGRVRWGARTGRGKSP